MAKENPFTFRKNDKEIYRWHSDLAQGNYADYYFEYLWFDAPLKAGEETYYLRVAPFSSCVKGSHGTTKGGTPGIGMDLLLPDGRCLDAFPIFDPSEYTELPFGGVWGDNSFTGEFNDQGQLESYEIKMTLGGIGIDLKARTIATGISVVKAEHGYSYYHPVKKLALGWWPVVPRAEVEGTLTIDGKVIKVSGPAYLDRQAGNQPTSFGGSSQKWWAWGHFWAGDYTATFTDSAPSAEYKFKHYSPFMLWKGSELILATYNFTNYIEQFDIDEGSGKFYPKAQSQKAYDGTLEYTCQITNGILVEPTTTSLEETSRYVRQFADVTMQLKRFTGFEDEVSGKIVIEYGAGMDYMPWEKLKKLK